MLRNPPAGREKPKRRNHNTGTTAERPTGTMSRSAKNRCELITAQLNSLGHHGSGSILISLGVMN
ncbi:MAG: hypothetical protein UZ07_CHB004002981 [Chlorobi bacterium OLB7]|nr:MAG: hypothetical protein UZ07_CHB004002981 [Chlorobi bacterium OLB7]